MGLRRALMAVAATVLTVVGAVAGAPEARAESYSGACRDALGVTVVVDFQGLGGGTVVRCAANFPAGGTGWKALELAGFAVEGPNPYRYSVVCRINDRPGRAETFTAAGLDYQESCREMPPAYAFWSYWHAPNGGSWTFSQKGAANREAIIGGYEGWSFSIDNGTTNNPPPGVAPSHAVTTAPPTSAAPSSAAPTPRATTAPATPAPSTKAPATPRPRATPTRKPRVSATPSAVSTASVAPASPTPRPATVSVTAAPTLTPTSASPSPSPTASEPSASALPEPTASSSPSPAATAEPVTAAPPDGPGPGTLLGLGAVAVFGVAGGVALWRRRRLL